MSNGTTGDWYHDKEKNEAVYKVLRYLAKHPEEGLACVGKDDQAKDLFETHGGITVPTDQGARVIFFPQHEQDTVGASVVLEVPSAAFADATDEQLRHFVLGNYPYWPPKFGGEEKKA